MKKKIFILMFTLSLAASSGICGVLNWSTVTANGLGDVNNVSFYPGSIFNGLLFIGSGNSSSGGGVWSTDGTSFISITNDGFGNADNYELIPFKQSFGGYLYTFTNNSANGTEVWKSATGGPFPGDWTQANVSGFGDPDNLQIGGSSSRSGWMYVGTGNWWGANGSEIWKTNGSTWILVAVSSPTFGSAYNQSTYPEAVFNDYLYCGTFNFMTGGQLWRLASPWENITNNGFGDTNNMSILPAYESFKGYLYAGTYNSATGAEVWRSINGSSGTWTQVNTDGFGDSNNMKITSFSMPGDGYLYVSVTNSFTGTEVWRTSGISWEQVNADGFGDGNNTRAYLSRTMFNGYLYAGTNNFVSGAHIWKVQLIGAGSATEEVVEERGKITVVGSTERKGIINPDKGDKLEIYFIGNKPGKYTLRIFTLLGELVHDEKKDSLAEGKFSWIPEDIASGVYIVHVEGPGVKIQKKMAILR